jgi:predicted DNA-binding WGR domain protein
MQPQEVNLYNGKNNSDKIYNIFLTQNDTGMWNVTATYGRRTAENLHQTTICVNESYYEALRLYNKKKTEKLNKGYDDITRPQNQQTRSDIASTRTKSTASRGNSVEWNGEETRKIFI